MEISKKGISKVIVHVILLTLALITVVPFLYVILISFGKNVIDTSALFVREFTLENYARLFGDTYFLNWILNSLLLATATMFVAVIIVSISVYCFSRLRFRGKNQLFRALLIIQIFPLSLSMVSIFRIFVSLGLLNRLEGLILVNSAFASAGLVILAKGYFDSIPFSLDEAAMIDGANKLQILFRITLPLAKPIVAVVAMQSFVIAYNEYVIASTVMARDLQAMPLAVGLQSMIVGQFGVNWSLYCAGAVLGSIPMIVLFYTLQRYFVGGLSAISEKG
ncbi:MAG TPA: sugar ABC transporter permease [Kosmotogaceae bacterium]|nr:sugar ABC transporter permease [Kosmotogaceae bacterium]